MKYKGKKLISPNQEIIPVPRGDGDDIIFIANAVLDHSPFDVLCPTPKPRLKKIDGVDIPDFKDPNYQKAVLKYSEKKTAWLVLTALKNSPDIEWEQVDYNDPSTWTLFRKELLDSGFSDIEINRIINGALSAQGLNEAKVEAARERFLQRQSLIEKLSSQKVDENFMLSGELVRDSE